MDVQVFFFLLGADNILLISKFTCVINVCENSKTVIITVCDVTHIT